jgi:hypothetical protein
VTILANAVSASGGTGPYQYHWSDGKGYWTGWSSSSGATLSYASNNTPSDITYSLIVSVEDSVPNASSPVNCGQVTVQGTGGGGNNANSGNLKLLIGHTTDVLPLANQTLRIAQGKQFQLQWIINNASQYYSCKGLPPGGSWNWSVDYATADKITSDSKNDIDSGYNPVGKYMFVMSCKKTADDLSPDTSSATLYLTTSGTEEI